VRRQSVDVVVVGATTVGLATAVGFAQTGLDVVAIDNVPAPRRSWTAIQHWSALPVLDSLGVLDEALVAGEATAHWGINVLATGEQIAFDLRELGPPVRHAFNLRLDPATLRVILRDRLAALRGELVTGVEVSRLREHADSVVVELSDGSSVAAEWVVGADGPASVVRRAAGIGFEGTTWLERAVGAVVRHDFAAAGYLDTTFQVDAGAGAVVERIGRRTWRYLYPESLALDEASIDERLHATLDGVTGVDVPILGWSTARMHQRCASTFRSGKVLLVGEAAHVAHPMVGHAPVSGWVDAATVVPAVLAALTGDGGVAVDQWADGRRRTFLDEEAPLSMSRMNLVARTPDESRLEVEIDAHRRASLDRASRRAFLVAEAAMNQGATIVPPAF
jgi:3-(3-hydroxy-phenyl)propionate hydroxylase